MYPIFIDGDIVANIIANNNNWLLKLSSNYSSKDVYFEKPRLEPYKIYTITSKFTEERFYLVATPRYNSDTRSYDIGNQVTVGSHPSCDICYSLKFSNDEYLKIALVDSNRWIAETNSPFFFASGERVKNGQQILNGDYVVFYGLKFIFIDSKIIVEIPQDNADMVKVSGLKLSEPETPLVYGEVENKGMVREDLPLYTEKDYFYRSPRFNYVIERAIVEIDVPPEPFRENDTPTILTIGPQLTMAAASVLSMFGLIFSVTSGTVNTYMVWISLVAMGITILGTLMWPLITKKYNQRKQKKHEAKRQKKYEKYLIQKQNLINFIKANQRQTLLENHPAPVQCVQIIGNRSEELWQRNTSHNDFLSVRVGMGKVPTNLDINRPKEQFSVEDDDNLFLAMKKIVNDSLFIDDAPVTYNLTERSIDAVVGDVASVKCFMDCLFLQLFTFHSYTDLKVVVFTKEPHEWDYLRIMPHCWDNQKSTRYFATSVEKLSAICNELEKIFDARTVNDEEVQLEDDGEDHEGGATYKDFQPYYLFFIDDMTLVRNVPLINKILHYKRNVGFSIIATSQNVSLLPSETSDFIFVSGESSYIMSSDTNSKQSAFSADFNTGVVDMYACAQALANIPIVVERGKFELPASISFLELYQYGRVEQLNCLARWGSNNPSLSLSVPIGIDQNNEVFLMDIHEKAFGPHGLIAGTTGSGKSEWIITFVLSLAVNFSPDEVQFVLIDYKGGGLAKSFENSEMNIRLPHLAGTITNLDKSEIFRSISAIESELKRRQAIFNEAREALKEGSMDIYKYQQYYRKGLVKEPMSHLLIICDEFAELKQQEPDFMDQLISTSRIGRSLGVHLILATQKPSGVVNDQIWSNSKFKVCLKVQDRSDSHEVLRKPDAAFLKQTGTFYLQVGNDDYYNLGQVAWAGAKYYPSDVVERKVDTSVQCIDDIGQMIASFKETEEVKESRGEELLNIVAYISEISKHIQLQCRPLWLTNIPPIIYLSDLKKKYQVKPSDKYSYNVIIGEYDEPREQKQGLLRIDLAGGNIAIIGKADTSIDKLISTIIWSSVLERTPAEIAYYIIDFGAETLRKYAKFPQVGEVASQDEIDKVAGILSLITDEMDRRKGILANYNGSFDYYNRVEKEKMSLIVVVINNFDIVGEVLPRSLDLLNELFRDAPKYGIIFIVSSNSTSSLGNRQLQFFNHTIVMQINDDGQYRTITNCRRDLIPRKIVGRGICKIDPDSDDSYCEFQTAMIAPEEKELNIIKNYADKCVEYYKCKVKQLAKIPEDITSDDVVKYISDLTNVPIGFSLYEKDIARYNFLSQKIHLVTGTSIEENINFVYGLASVLSKVSNVKVRVVDMLGIFKKPILDIKLFDDDIDVVFGALEKDTLTRAENQDYGVNLIIGAGQFKNRLSKGGIEIFRNLFDHLKDSKKTVYVLIDDYDKLRSLKLESWFTSVDTTRGLWLGQGLTSQGLIECEPIKSEDKKYNYPGLGFEVEDKKYKVIKTLMDSDE